MGLVKDGLSARKAYGGHSAKILLMPQTDWVWARCMKSTSPTHEIGIILVE